MGQVTIYIDSETEQKLNLMIKKSGLSKSKWIAELIKEKASRKWPDEIAHMAGSWKDFPLAEDLRQNLGNDSQREEF